ncbi:MAG: CehA/McbA family metallohydrolase [Verrucomicrobiae bacterium]|jgi:predicted metal-dependent phosphoesterase TrpH|nr:CehA/McbA family metallohydrolase [Verrucomicrobiae bacterium]
MLYSFDLHLHTFFSRDATDSPESMIDAAKKRGLSGIAITDHDTCEGVDYLRRKGLLRDDGEAVDGFLIIPGVEVSTQEGHLLCLGTTLPFMKREPAKKVISVIHERGGIAVAPHPFDRFRAGIREEVLNDLDLSAIETFNAAISLNLFNKHAATYAAHRGLARTASSDAHQASTAGISSTSYQLPELSLSAFLAAVPNGGILLEKKLSFQQFMKKNCKNWISQLQSPSPKKH